MPCHQTASRERERTKGNMSKIELTNTHKNKKNWRNLLGKLEPVEIWIRRKTVPSNTNKDLMRKNGARSAILKSQRKYGRTSPILARLFFCLENGFNLPCMYDAKWQIEISGKTPLLGTGWRLFLPRENGKRLLLRYFLTFHKFDDARKKKTGRT